MNIKQKLFRKKRPKEAHLKYWFYLFHLWVGLLTSMIVFVVCFTGSIYVFRNQIVDFSNRDLRTVLPQSNRLSLDAIINNQKQTGWVVTSIRIPIDKEESYKLDVSKNTDQKIIYVNPYSGIDLGTEDTSLRAFFSLMLGIHTSLLIPKIGKDIVGVSILLFVLMLVSGFVLWLPKKISKIKNNLKIKWNARFRRLNFDLHKVLGFYFLVPLLFVSITGLYVSYSWVKSGLIQVMGGPPVLSNSLADETDTEFSDAFNKILQEVKQQELSVASADCSLEQIFETSLSELPYSGCTSINLPTTESNKFTVTKLNRNNWLHAIVSDVLTYNRKGDLITKDLFGDKVLHKQFVALSLPLHTGEILGLPSLCFYFMICLVGCSLPVTGFIIWWKR